MCISRPQAASHSGLPQQAASHSYGQLNVETTA
jgi:hypothetical protein